VSLGQDRDGNLWLGTDELGAYKLAAGILSYSTGEIGMEVVLSVDETRSGELYIAGGTGFEGSFRIGFRSGVDFKSIAPRLPRSINSFGARPGRRILQDRAGEWWLATSQGLIRYPSLESASQLSQTAPKAVYTSSDGLPSDIVIVLYEDRAGNIWVGTQSTKLVYWSRSEQKFIGIVTDGVTGNACAFGEDGAGQVWIGDEAGQLWRVRDGRASLVAGLGRRVWIRGIMFDHGGRLWMATSTRGSASTSRWSPPLDSANTATLTAFPAACCAALPKTGTETFILQP
jgi:hypothetical protein